MDNTCQIRLQRLQEKRERNLAEETEKRRQGKESNKERVGKRILMYAR